MRLLHCSLCFLFFFFLLFSSSPLLFSPSPLLFSPFSFSFFFIFCFFFLFFFLQLLLPLPFLPHKIFPSLFLLLQLFIFYSTSASLFLLSFHSPLSLSFRLNSFVPLFFLFFFFFCYIFLREHLVLIIIDDITDCNQM